MEPLITQITETFPDIQAADTHRILDFLGFSTEDIFNADPSYRLIKGESIFIPSCIVLDDIEREEQHFLHNGKTHIEVTVTVNGKPLQPLGTDIVPC